METLFLLCLVVGGTVLVCQFALTVLGLGGDGDSFDGDGFDGDVELDIPDGDVPDGDPNDSTRLFGILSFKTIVAALAFFGAAGMAASKSGQSLPVTWVIALGAAAIAIYTMHWSMKTMRRLDSDGTVRIRKAIGKQGTVYLAIPPEKTGRGKIHINLQNRMVEFEAMTSEPNRIATGSTIVVTDILGPDLVEVELAPVAATPIPVT